MNAHPLPDSPASAMRTSSTQPAMNYAYAAVMVAGGKETPCNIIYSGFTGGRHLVRVPGHDDLYPATRTSSEKEEPEFRFEIPS